MPSLMPVSSTTLAGMGMAGSTNVSNASVIFPFSTRTALISMSLSIWVFRPVVSVSNTTKLPLSGPLAPLPYTTGIISSTK